MNIAVLLLLIAAGVTMGLPQGRSERQERKPETSNPAPQQQANFGFGNFPQLGGGVGSWPMGQGIGQRQGFDQMWSQSPFAGQPNAKGGFNFALPKIEGSDGVSATAGMSCSYENGKKKCTNHQNQAKTRF